ncbi:helix-turn-helix transcriptional regulator [Sphingobacterium sp. SGG-5]|uniref:helix-turn-helix domain-containing protein n=1 Tax=Sphingobacterium sp. SGG-5 TaxID=2710881 RepID=UPI0013E9F33E|nr:AraC family transcriptional regulator [Sphingobacterium sp. SGG-5]NGM62565.1 helix-turn-helix transcriptional regulator [Sphingobacterium sp. SGG-5]
MDAESLMKEITPLTQNDCFTFFSRTKKEFNFPLHYHEEYELNLIINAQGARRVIGDHMDNIGDMELVLVGPNLPHAWFTHQCESDAIREVTVQWHKDLFDDRFLSRNQLHAIKTLLQQSVNGLSFSEETIKSIAPKLLSINQNTGFDSVISLMLILRELSVANNTVTLSSRAYHEATSTSYNSRRIDKAFDFMHKNYQTPIQLKEMAKLVNMTEVSFSRFIKKRTGNTFIDSLNNIRLGHACRMLIETTHTVAEISYKTGFNNISNFNKVFKKKKGCTPSEFRLNYQGTRIFI